MQNTFTNFSLIGRDLKDEKGSSSLPEHEAKTFKKVTLSSSVADVPSAVLQENASKLEAKSCMGIYYFNILDIYNS